MEVTCLSKQHVVQMGYINFHSFESASAGALNRFGGCSYNQLCYSELLRLCIMQDTAFSSCFAHFRAFPPFFYYPLKMSTHSLGIGVTIYRQPGLSYHRRLKITITVQEGGVFVELVNFRMEKINGNISVEGKRCLEVD